MSKCIECHQKESDNLLRKFRDKVTGLIYEGYRMFCSDACETAYVDKSQSSGAEERFERIQEKPKSFGLN